MRRAALVVGVMLLAAVVSLPAIAANLDATYLDTFGAQGFSGNDGDTHFAGPWVEISESNGPTVGYVWVWDHPYCEGEFCLMMGGIDEEADRSGAYRAADLSGAVSATLSFDYGRELIDDDSEGTGVVQVSPNGGGSWNTVKTVSLDNDDGGLRFQSTVVISDWATADTVIRFRITDAENLEAYWLSNNVKIAATFESPMTTTTTEPITTTSTTEPDTTTTPGVATTTTTKPRATATTTSPKRAHELPPSTTSTVPRTTSTTLPPATVSDVSPEDHDTMVMKTGLAIVSAAPPMAMPAFSATSDADGFQHAEPVEALAAAFFTDAGKYGGNLLPSLVLGIVIAVVTLLGIGSRRQD